MAPLLTKLTPTLRLASAKQPLQTFITIHLRKQPKKERPAHQAMAM